MFISTKKHLKSIILLIAAVTFSLGLSPILPTFAANDVCSNGSVPPEVKAANGCDNSAASVPDVVTNILNVVISLAGLVSVIFIIIGGVNYMTSTGEPSKVKKAKDTILYAVIGLIICVLAFAIVNFVIRGIINQA